MAKQQIATKTETESGVVIAFSTGEKLEADLNNYPEEIRLRLAIHGLKQKLGDAYAGAEPEDAYALASAVDARLREGTWTTRTAGSSSAKVSKLIQALARATGQPIEVCREKVADMDDDAIKSLKAHPAIKKALAEMRLEAAAKEAEAAEPLPDLA